MSVIDTSPRHTTPAVEHATPAVEHTSPAVVERTSSQSKLICFVNLTLSCNLNIEPVVQEPLPPVQPKLVVPPTMGRSKMSEVGIGKCKLCCVLITFVVYL